MPVQLDSSCFQSMFSSVICCSQCHLVSDLQSFFVIVCLETWQNTRGNGSCDTGCLFMSFQLLYARLHVLIVLMIMTEKTDDCFFLASQPARCNLFFEYSLLFFLSQLASQCNLFSEYSLTIIIGVHLIGLSASGILTKK